MLLGGREIQELVTAGLAAGMTYEDWVPRHFAGYLGFPLRN